MGQPCLTYIVPGRASRYSPITQHNKPYHHHRCFLSSDAANKGPIILFNTPIIRINPGAYFIFVTFFTQPQFENRKFYTWKRVNVRQKLPHDKIA